MKSPAVLVCSLSLCLAVTGVAQTGPAQPGAHPWVALARGRVEPQGGIIQVAAAAPGIVKAIDAREGDRVAAGQPLATLRDDTARLNLALAEAQVAEARAAAEPLAIRLAAARREADRLTRLVAAQLANRQDLDQARDLVAELGAEIARTQAAVAVATAQVDLARHAVAACVVRAPVAGEVIRRLVSPGEAVGTDASPAMFWLAPDGPRTVVAELDEDTAPLIHAGERAEVVTDAAKPQTFPAAVRRVGLLYGPRRPVTDDPAQQQDVRVVDCLLTLDQANPPLLIGQRVVVRFLPVDPTSR